VGHRMMVWEAIEMLPMSEKPQKGGRIYMRATKRPRVPRTCVYNRAVECPSATCKSWSSGKEHAGSHQRWPPDGDARFVPVQLHNWHGERRTNTIVSVCTARVHAQVR